MMHHFCILMKKNRKLLEQKMSNDCLQVATSVFVDFKQNFAFPWLPYKATEQTTSKFRFNASECLTETQVHRDAPVLAREGFPVAFTSSSDMKALLALFSDGTPKAKQGLQFANGLANSGAPERVCLCLFPISRSYYRSSTINDGNMI